LNAQEILQESQQENETKEDKDKASLQAVEINRNSAASSESYKMDLKRILQENVNHRTKED